ncbi:MAG: hypothetical protein ORN83_11370 [Chthoniobacteraceae bacterium]|nr:hypothetical protein [Chthoniobacteraceae bacterium]
MNAAAPHSSLCAPVLVWDFSDRTQLVFRGLDRLRYLNGQLTQDLKKLTPIRALPACVTNAKGRLQADVWVSLGEDVLIVDAAPELREILAARLERYIVADDVTLEDCTGSGGLLHCFGFNPEEHPVLREFSATFAARLGEDGWDVRVPVERLAAVRTALGLQLGSAADWERLRLERGIPQWGNELSEETLPPEAGLERTHIDYHKGCYIGQEVISRLKSVGHVNRKLCRFRGDGAILPGKGAPLCVVGGDGSASGTLTSVVAVGDGFLALGYVKRGCEESTFSTANGILLQRLAS